MFPLKTDKERFSHYSFKLARRGRVWCECVKHILLIKKIWFQTKIHPNPQGGLLEEEGGEGRGGSKSNILERNLLFA